MTGEVALLLTLLDRPGDAEVRLVYADWLEDNGQLDLAEWLRLHVALPRLPAGGRRRRQETRLRELREEHRKDWVDVGGVLLSWHSALLLFGQRLAEAVAWCRERGPKALRTPELLPEVTANVSGIEPLWRCPRFQERAGVVHQVANRRAAKLDESAMLLEAPASDLAGGRLLLFDPDLTHSDSDARLRSDGFIDAYQAPAWDTWLFYFDDGAEGHRRAHSHWEAEWIMRRQLLPVPYPSYLAVWVPPALVPAVDWAVNASARPSINWVENVDCELTMRLRELGWFQAPDFVKVEARAEQRIGFAWEPKSKRALSTP
jgi:uncharacterized protein (TIGR02996 family)